MYCLFISHQWLGSTCADPFGNQLAVLREALRNVLSGQIKVQTDMITFLIFQRLEQLSPREIEKLSEGYIWPVSQQLLTATSYAQEHCTVGLRGSISNM